VACDARQRPRRHPRTGCFRDRLPASARTESHHRAGARSGRRAFESPRQVNPASQCWRTRLSDPWAASRRLGMRKRFPYALAILTILGLAIAAVPAAHSASQDETDQTPPPSENTPSQTEPNQRVGGDLEVSVEQRGFSYLAGNASITTPLPEGYPAPTPPGAIDIKQY